MDASVTLCTMDACMSLLRIIDVFVNPRSKDAVVHFKSQVLYALAIEAPLLQGGWLLHIIACIASAMQRRETVTRGYVRRPVLICMTIWILTAIIPLFLNSANVMDLVSKYHLPTFRLAEGLPAWLAACLSLEGLTN